MRIILNKTKYHFATSAKSTLLLSAQNIILQLLQNIILQNQHKISATLDRRAAGYANYSRAKM